MTGGIFTVLADAAAKEHPMGVVVGLGMGTVFAGLIVMVLLLGIINAIFSKIDANKKPEQVPKAPGAAVAEEKMDEETVAAVSAAIAETMGRDVSGIRITSIKKVN